MEKPKTAALNDLADLAPEMGVTGAAVYAAARKGWIPVIPCGRRLKMTPAAYAYHRRFGWGPNVPRHGTAEAVEYERAHTCTRESAEAA